MIRLLFVVFAAFLCLPVPVQAQYRFDQHTDDQAEQAIQGYLNRDESRLNILQSINRLLPLEDSVRDMSGQRGVFVYLMTLAGKNQQVGRASEAAMLANQALTIAEQLGSQRLVFMAADRLVTCYRDLDLADQAFYYVSTATAAAENLRERKYLYDITIKEAQLLFTSGKFDEVHDLLSGYRLTTVADHVDSLFRAEVLLMEGLNRSAQHQENPQIGYDDLVEALEWLGKQEGAHADKLRVSIIGAMGNFALISRNYALAVNHFQSILQWAEGQNNRQEMMFATYNLARTYAMQGSYAKAFDFFELSLTHADSLQFGEWQERNLMELARVQEARGNHQSAYDYLNFAKRTSDSLHTQRVTQQSIEAQALYDLDRKETQIKLLEEAGRRQTFFQYTLLTGILSLIAIIVLIIRLNLQQRQTNQLLERKNEEIALQKQKLEELNETKNRLFSIIGHDLRGPVGNIRTFLEMLDATNEDLSPDEVHSIVENAKRSATATFTLLNNLLDWANHQMGEVNVQLESLRLLDIVQESELFLMGISRTKNVRITKHINADTLVYADRNIVATIVRNLLSNAIKFTREGGRVHVACEIKAGKVVLSVSDNGVGIPVDIKSRLFYEKVASRKGTGKEAGSGLGLFLCKTLAEEVGGRIWLESEVDIGTTVFVELNALPAVNGG
jgi:signal transduction histidine kinase